MLSIATVPLWTEGSAVLATDFTHLDAALCENDERGTQRRCAQKLGRCNCDGAEVRRHSSTILFQILGYGQCRAPCRPSESTCENAAPLPLLRVSTNESFHGARAIVRCTFIPAKIICCFVVKSRTGHRITMTLVSSRVQSSKYTPIHL